MNVLTSGYRYPEVKYSLLLVVSNGRVYHYLDVKKHLGNDTWLLKNIWETIP